MSKQKKNTPVRKSPPSSNRLLFILITILFPFILFGLLESTLRLFHYGPDLSLFTKETINGTEYYSLNSQIGNRYFNQVQFSPATSPEYFAVVKPEKTFRIFWTTQNTFAFFV